MSKLQVADRDTVQPIRTGSSTGNSIGHSTGYPSMHARTCRGDALGQLDDLAEVLHDAGCGCGVGAARQNCWAWTSGRYHRAAKQAQQIGVHLASAA